MRRLNELKPDVVDFHYRWGLTYADAVRRYDGKKVFTYHNTFGEGAGPSRAFSILNDELFMRSLRFCDRIVCVSEFVMRDLSGRGINPAKIVAVPNGVELADHADDGEDDFILFVGRLVSTKGLVYLIKAMRQIETKLIVCGEGPELGRLKRLVARYALNERVTFAGRVSSELRDKLMSTCKVFVMPSVFESYGIAVAEAMSHGRPIVACRVGGLPDVVQDAGFLVPPKDANALAAGVNRLLSDAGKRRELGHRAQQLSRDYSWEKAAEDMERIYSVIAGVG
jgi:glycosyltransferase involved in cell wall biosynthesis